MRVPCWGDECKEESSECVPVGGWNFSLALGAGVRTDPVVHEGTIPLVVIPQFSYYGEHFFIDDLDAGVTLLDSDRTTLSLIASPGYDRVFFYRSDPQNMFVSGLGTSTEYGHWCELPPEHVTQRRQTAAARDDRSAHPHEIPTTLAAVDLSRRPRMDLQVRGGDWAARRPARDHRP